MKIEVLEETGIRHEGLGHMKQGEIRIVPDDLGLFFVSNGWAKDVAGVTPTGTRGEIDYEDPAAWAKGRRGGKDAKPSTPSQKENQASQGASVVQPKNITHRQGEGRK